MSDTKIDRIIIALEMEDLPQNREQVGVMIDCLELFCQRGNRHGEVWKNSGWQGALFDARKKIERLWNEFMAGDTPPDDLDSALDAINYLAFFVRAQRTGLKSLWKWAGDGGS